MKILRSALVSTVWVAALLAAASPVQAHDAFGSTQGSDFRDDFHDAGVIRRSDYVSPPQHKPHVHGPPQWPRPRDFSGSGMTALHSDGSAGVVVAGQPDNPLPKSLQDTDRDHTPRLRKATKLIKS
ncbi:hypothetical protein PHYBOEH_001239 [Phytophthora boehmeriae]|uniref:RxLR effector protein n=1 Tax=Phytophthora boehmeriae TaxID=109152 RepID=A0A8T1V6J1_9STRA|nr:hypothetical protein PHYBOEH_001239 [Phytophthora boehmeriae]